jgi:hypothetical protein
MWWWLLLLLVLAAVAPGAAAADPGDRDLSCGGSTTVTDGVRVLRAAVALPVALECAPAH